MRFGNKAFKLWLKHIIDNETPIFLQSLLSNEKYDEYVMELDIYINNSFGNEVRIDYGTGHETNIMIFFYNLYQLNIINNNDITNLILICFKEYIKLMRKLQMTYLLEPAGSHGVWGLDDYHCLIFLFGSAQLRNDSNIFPNSIHEEIIINNQDNIDKYLYLEGISFIKKLKNKAPFSETSPMLNDISHLHSWDKVYTGLIKLYQGEVLNKLPVMQHTVFGKLFKWTGPKHTSKTVDSSTSIDNNSLSTSHIAATAPWAKKNPNTTIPSTIPPLTGVPTSTTSVPLTTTSVPYSYPKSVLTMNKGIEHIQHINKMWANNNTTDNNNNTEENNTTTNNNTDDKKDSTPVIPPSLIRDW
eukprot:TRINITY_DN52629_c0_g1_i1.p1 TRINITY_DN52629_c0_g1~~TRINITY_DN52629_c0_g1_i1.p1  ORF type:complete len:357 (+),score=-39.93 TRINITY_DN52629_c0_g1_i1:96-1166(+)